MKKLKQKNVNEDAAEEKPSCPPPWVNKSLKKQYVVHLYSILSNMSVGDIVYE